jgi:hypothetical protein
VRGLGSSDARLGCRSCDWCCVTEVGLRPSPPPRGRHGVYACLHVCSHGCGSAFVCCSDLASKVDPDVFYHHFGSPVEELQVSLCLGWDGVGWVGTECGGTEWGGVTGVGWAGLVGWRQRQFSLWGVADGEWNCWRLGYPRHLGTML